MFKDSSARGGGAIVVRTIEKRYYFIARCTPLILQVAAPMLSRVSERQLRLLASCYYRTRACRLAKPVMA